MPCFCRAEHGGLLQEHWFGRIERQFTEAKMQCRGGDNVDAVSAVEQLMRACGNISIGYRERPRPPARFAIRVSDKYSSAQRLPCTRMLRSKGTKTAEEDR